MKASAFLLLLVAAVASAQTTTHPNTENIVATFCQGEYALCIKAPCAPIVTRKPDGTFEIQQANCTCDVLTGWSMGPLACDKRTPVTVSGRTYIESTYSNFFNKTDLTLSCPNANQVWAICYGAP